MKLIHGIIAALVAVFVVDTSVSAEVASLKMLYAGSPANYTNNIVMAGMSSNDAAALVTAKFDDATLVNLAVSGSVGSDVELGKVLAAVKFTADKIDVPAQPLGPILASKLADAVVRCDGKELAHNLYLKLSFFSQRSKLQGMVDECCEKVPQVKYAIWKAAMVRSAVPVFTLDDQVSAMLSSEAEVGTMGGLPYLPPSLLTLNRSTVAASILDAATTAAKKKLRQEGKSFVVYTVTTTNGTNIVKTVVNPLTDKVQPVVTAMNAPLAIGLEKSFADLGINLVDATASRNAFKTWADAYADKIMNGEIPVANLPAYLPAIKVALGVEGYNKWIDVYNNGGTLDVMKSVAPKGK